MLGFNIAVPETVLGELQLEPSFVEKLVVRLSLLLIHAAIKPLFEPATTVEEVTLFVEVIGIGLSGLIGFPEKRTMGAMPAMKATIFGNNIEIDSLRIEILWPLNV